jgi:Arc/MetJ family transcription regulator
MAEWSDSVMARIRRIGAGQHHHPGVRQQVDIQYVTYYNFCMSRTTIRLPADLLAQAQAFAGRTDRSFTQLVADALRYEMQRLEVSARVSEPLPVYGGQGLRPGVDLADNAALLDVMDGT